MNMRAFKIYILVEVFGELEDFTKVYYAPDEYKAKQIIENIDKDVYSHVLQAYTDTFTGYEWDFLSITIKSNQNDEHRRQNTPGSPVLRDGYTDDNSRQIK